jgi:hypothetical protein
MANNDYFRRLWLGVESTAGTAGQPYHGQPPPKRTYVKHPDGNWYALLGELRLERFIMPEPIDWSDIQIGSGLDLIPPRRYDTEFRLMFPSGHYLKVDYPDNNGTLDHRNYFYTSRDVFDPAYHGFTQVSSIYVPDAFLSEQERTTRLQVEPLTASFRSVMQRSPIQWDSRLEPEDTVASFWTEYESQKSAANKRAEELLNSLLTKNQRKCYREKRPIAVMGNRYLYRLHNTTIFGIEVFSKNGRRRIGKMCARPSNSGTIPVADTLAAQVLAIRYDEDTFLAKANKGHDWNVSRTPRNVNNTNNVNTIDGSSRHYFINPQPIQINYEQVYERLLEHTSLRLPVTTADATTWTISWG